MKHTFAFKTSALLLVAGLASAAQANPITGSIGFIGDYIQNGGTLGDLTTATSMTITDTVIGSSTGDLSGASLISFATPIPVNPPVGLTTLWSVLVSGITYSFTVTSETQDLTTPEALHLKGTGILSDGNAANNTPGTFQLGFGVSGASFQWQSTSATSVTTPDGGATLLLLGSVLSSLGLLRARAKA